MKRHGHLFDCGIAGRRVSISLRPGGAVGEPDSVYVRCDERDCQHVDLNRPPCPLRVEMFADGSDTRVRDYLLGSRGLRVCYGCLTERLGVSHDQVRRASWSFKGTFGFSIRPARCHVCGRRAVTIAFSRAAPEDHREAHTACVETPAQTVGPEVVVEAVARFLHGRVGNCFCERCLARDLRVDAGDIRAAILTLERDGTLEGRWAQCVSCLVTTRTMQYAEACGAEDTYRRVIEFLSELDGQPVCASCIAFASNVALGEARSAAEELARAALVRRCDASCSVCGRTQTTVALLDDSAMSTANGAERTAVEYRGFRIAVSSFQTATGWCPVALVTASGAIRHHGTQVFVLSLTATKDEADEAALAAARHGIDKR